LAKTHLQRPLCLGIGRATGAVKYNSEIIRIDAVNLDAKFAIYSPEMHSARCSGLLRWSGSVRSDPHLRFCAIWSDGSNAFRRALGGRLHGEREKSGLSGAATSHAKINAVDETSDSQWRVPPDESGTRLDRFIKRRAPGLPPGLIQRLIRQRRIEIDGVPVTRNAHAVRGGEVIVLPGDVKLSPGNRFANAAEPSSRAAEYIRSCLLHSDPRCVILNKPAGLATQGGSGIGSRHVEAMLPGLGRGRYWLVHRLDKEVSGTLAIARDVGAATTLGEHFRRRRVEKTYWALVKGAAPARSGTIALDIEGKPSETEYRVVQDLGGFGAWLALRPLTGRKHQLRIHCAEGLKCPIVGETRYGPDAELRGMPPIGPPMHGIADLASGGLHLHARELSFPKLSSYGGPSRKSQSPMLTVQAPLSEHMKISWDRLGMLVNQGDDVDWN
jgi:23S rRNA pseudouridine955/2504/2580 synthase